MPLWASYTLSSSRYVNGDFDRNYLPYAPFHMLSAGVDLALPSGFEADVRALYVSAQLADPANTVAASVDGLLGRIDARVNLDAQVAWRVELSSDVGLRCFIAAKNLTNQVYVASRSPAGIQPAGFFTVLGGIDVGW